MNKENLVIYDFKILYEILNEISDHINFKLTNINKITDLDLKAQDNYLVISNKKIKFFHQGPNNKWQDSLNDEIRLEIEDKLNTEMKELGYL